MLESVTLESNILQAEGLLDDAVQQFLTETVLLQVEHSSWKSGLGQLASQLKHCQTAPLRTALNSLQQV